MYKRLYYRIRYLLTRKSPMNSAVKSLTHLKYNKVFRQYQSQYYGRGVLFDTYKFWSIRECIYQSLRSTLMDDLGI